MTPSIQKLYNAQIKATPQYTDQLNNRFADVSDTEMQSLEAIATQILRIAGDNLPKICAGYAWVCEAVLKEEWHFRRHGEYRLKTFQEAYDQVYNDPEVMDNYVDGILLTQLWWPNHARGMIYLKEKFLPMAPDGYSHLEVGPGHGLLLSFPAEDPRCSYVEAWDVSDTSIAATRESLKSLGVKRDVTLRNQDLFDVKPGKQMFDSVVISEVLEHLETPDLALKKLQTVMAPEGRIYINIPINSPWPDHLFNLPTTDAVIEYIEATGLEIIDAQFEPQMEYTLEQCRKMDLSISCLVTAKKRKA